MLLKYQYTKHYKSLSKKAVPVLLELYEAVYSNYIIFQLKDVSLHRKKGRCSIAIKNKI
jgi:hypothetical protein